MDFLKTAAACAAAFLALGAAAQTPVANRVKAMAAALPEHSSVAAKYTDNRRHCLYYVNAHRLYRYDALTDRIEEIPLSGGRSSVVSTMLDGSGDVFLVVVDRGREAPRYGRMELWRMDSTKPECAKIGTGREIRRSGGRVRVVCAPGPGGGEETMLHFDLSGTPQVFQWEREE